MCHRCGGGRTAVFIAVDYCLKQLEMEEVVDVYSAVLHLRRFRKNMVRSPVSCHSLVLFLFSVRLTFPEQCKNVQHVSVL